MVVIFSPRAAAGSNASFSACQGVVHHNTLRGGSTTPAPIRDLAFALFGIILLLNLGSLPVAYRLRNEPRFRTVRPFFATAYLMKSLLTASSSPPTRTLPQVFPGIPCAYVLFCYVCCVGGAGSVLFTRALIVTVESQYATLALGSSPVVSRDSKLGLQLSSNSRDIEDDDTFITVTTSSSPRALRVLA